MLRAAFRRIAVIVAVALGGTAAISAALGALSRSSVLHALAVGYYVVGVALLIGCFVVGVRGPWRRTSSGDDEEPLAMPPSMMGALFGSGTPRRRRSMRKVTPEERREARLTSVGLFALALLLVVVGAAIDPSRRAF